MLMSASLITIQAKNTNHENTTISFMEKKAIHNRLKQIQQLDFKTLSNGDKKAIKNELNDFKTKLSSQSPGGIYLSTGALLLIIILLIIFL